MAWHRVKMKCTATLRDWMTVSVVRAERRRKINHTRVSTEFWYTCKISTLMRTHFIIHSFRSPLSLSLALAADTKLLISIIWNAIEKIVIFLTLWQVIRANNIFPLHKLHLQGKKIIHFPNWKKNQAGLLVCRFNFNRLKKLISKRNRFASNISQTLYLKLHTMEIKFSQSFWHRFIVEPIFSFEWF